MPLDASKPVSRKRVAKGTPRPPKEMNGLETAYAERLHARKLAGEVIDYKFESLTLRLYESGGRERSTYCPDFLVMLADCTLEIHEIKGPHEWEDAIVKLRWAATQFPFRFVICRRDESMTWSVDPV